PARKSAPESRRQPLGNRAGDYDRNILKRGLSRLPGEAGFTPTAQKRFQTLETCAILSRTAVCVGQIAHKMHPSWRHHFPMPGK
ncbi:MAG TPA: hypothetical protein VJ904_06595, partial [Tichowtungia sp.]|nr:hypothetical protein [Tichowtungia sp.]